MTLPPEALQAGLDALEAADGCKCCTLTSEEIVTLVGEAVLKEAAERQRAAIAELDPDDHWAVFYRIEDVEKLPDLIDPDKQEQP